VSASAGHARGDGLAESTRFGLVSPTLFFLTVFFSFGLQNREIKYEKNRKNSCSSNKALGNYFSLMETKLKTILEPFILLAKREV
jgi:hypothetical protein